MPDPVATELIDEVAWLRFDDGKANTISPASLAALGNALDRAEEEARAVVLLGRPARFCAGFDLTALGEGGASARELVLGGARLLLRLAEAPIPVAAGCTGHALGMGALLLLAADLRVGARGDFKIGLNEVGIGMTLPDFAAELAAERLSRRHLLRSTVLADIHDPDSACDAGFLDHVVEPEAIEPALREHALRLAKLPRRAFRETKRRMRGAMVERVRASLDADVASWGIR